MTILCPVFYREKGQRSYNFLIAHLVFVSTLISMSGLDQNLSLVIRSLLVDPKEVVASPEYRLEKEVEAMNLKYR